MRLGIRWSGLRTKIIAWSFVPTAIILTTVALVGFYAYQQVTQDLTIQSSREVARLSAGQLVTELANYSNPLTSLARTSALYEQDPAQQHAALVEAGNRLMIFDGGVLILDNYGTVVAAQPSRPEVLGQDWSSRDYFRQLIRAPATVFSNVVNDGPGGTPVVVVAVPITNVRGELVGILAGMFRVDIASQSRHLTTLGCRACHWWHPRRFSIPAAAIDRMEANRVYLGCTRRAAEAFADLPGETRAH